MYKKSKSQVICDAICGILMLVSILVFILVGVLAGVWHPTWVVIPCSGIMCGIISIIVNTQAALSKNNNAEKENKNSK